MADSVENVTIEFRASEVDDDVPGTYSATVDSRVIGMLTSTHLSDNVKKNIMKNIAKQSAKTIDRPNKEQEQQEPEKQDLHEPEKQDLHQNSDNSPHFWTHTQEQDLVDIRLKLETEFSKGVKSHSTLWQKIKKELNIKNLTITQIINKWNALKKKYKKVIDHNNKSGNSRLDFKYMDQFEEVFQTRAATAPTQLIDSLCPNTVTPENNQLKADDKLPDVQGPSRKSSKSSDTSKKFKSEQIQTLKDMQNVGQQMLTEVKKMHDQKMARFDRFLDILDKGFKK